MSDTAVLSCETQSRFKKYRLLLFVAISVGYLVVYFQRVAPAAFGPIIVDDLGLAMSDMGLMASMYFWAQGLGCLPAGLLTDVWGARRLMAAGLLSTALATALFAMGGGLVSLSVARFIIGLSVSVVFIGAMKIFASWYKPDELATMSGLLLAVGNMGAMLSTRPLTMLMMSIGWRSAFWCIAIYTLVAAAIIWLYGANRPQDKGYVLDTVAPTTPATPKENISMRAALGAVFRIPQFYILSVLTIVYYGTFMSTGGLWASPFLQQIYGLSKETAASIIMLFPLGMIVGSPLGGYISDKILKSRKKAMILGATINASIYVPLVFFPMTLSVASLYVLFFIFGISCGFFILCVPAAKELVEMKYAATAMGANNAIGALGAAVFQYLCGLIITSFDKLPSGAYSLEAYNAMFTFCLCSLAVGIVVMLFFREKKFAG